jgi:PHD/YefM family antitoxin component YafN of YafNO toxin-antitoxin module
MWTATKTKGDSMATTVLERKTLPEPLSSCFAAPRIAMMRQQGGDVVLSPIIDPDDYDNDTDYLNAIPGMAEKLIAAHNAPASERVPVPDDWIDDEV